jgi:hypothetical protein
MAYRQLMLFLLLVTQLALCSCATYFAHEGIQNLPEYDPSRIPFLIEGEYLGEANQGNVSFQHYYFPTFPWPAWHGQYMHLFLSETQTEPIVINMDKRLSVKEPIIYFYKERKRTLIIDKTSSVKSKALLYVYHQSRETDLKDIIKSVATQALNSENEIAVVTLSYTKNGEQSAFSVGKILRHGGLMESPPLKGPYTLHDSPYQSRWRHPLDYWLYIVSVPVDVVTSPLQLPYWVYTYYQNRGLSPK